MEDNEAVRYISADKFDEISPYAGRGRGWRAAYKQVVKDLKVNEAVIIPCPEVCWTSFKMKTCASTTHVHSILGAGNYKTKHLEKRGTPNNHIAVKRIH